MHIRTAEKFNKAWFFAGAAAVLLMLAPYLILGENSVITYHDQLDGEMIAYILQAKHLFQGNVLPEFMGGALKTALTLPAPAFVLLFLTGDYFAALVSMQMIGSLCGYIGMYFLVKEFTDCKGVAAVTGVLYAYLPFLPVYGLSQYGIPLLVFCLLQIRRGEHVKRAFGYVICYALTSSMVLVGFGVLGILAMWAVGEFVHEKRMGAGLKQKTLRLGGAWLVLLFLYTLENFTLIEQMLGFGADGASDMISHKAEYALTPVPFWERFIQNLLQGGQHSEDMHLYFLQAAASALILFASAWAFEVFGRKRAVKVSEVQKRLVAVIGMCAGINLSLAAVSALWESVAGVALRSRLEALGAFQLQRLLWLTPCFWYLLSACALAFALEWYRQSYGVLWRLGAVFGLLAMLAALGITGIKVFASSDMKPNLQKLRIPDYKAISYSDYYAMGVMEQVEDFLARHTKQDKADYRVASLGIDPAAAYYHGFYCLDGYSNNYSLNYKHCFRNIIKPELDKNEYLRDYYDTWGNRCYLFTSECPGYYTMEKNTFYFNNYEIDVDSFKKLGGRFIISAAYIINAKEQKLVLLREEPFETQESYYRIFLYGLAEE